MANRTASARKSVLLGTCMATLLVCLCLCLCLAGTGAAIDSTLPPAQPTQQPLPADQHFQIPDGANPGTPLPWVPRSWFWTVVAALVATGTVAAFMARALLRKKKATATLAKSESQFRQITANIREVFWVGALDFRRLDYVSPAYETIWGRSCESLYAAPQSWLESIFPNDRESVIAFIEREETVRFGGVTFPEFSAAADRQGGLFDQE